MINLKEKIDALDWCPNGEADAIYQEFIKNPEYDDGFLIFKLLITLVYEKQYENAQNLALKYIDATKGECSPEIYFFYGIASDLSNQREKAVWAYKKVLKYDNIPPSTYDQFYIGTLCREFVEHLLAEPYSEKCAKSFDFPEKTDFSRLTPEYYEELLKEPYMYEDASKYLTFSYDFANPKLNILREKYDLEKIAGNGNEIDKIINLMKWVHRTVGWDGMNGIKTESNSLSIINETVTNSLKVNCRGIGIVLSEVYLAMGFKSKFVVCLPKSVQDDDCHIVTIVYSETKRKWLMMDACLQSYATDEEGNILSIREIRDYFINHSTVNFPDAINANGISGDYSWYRGYYLRKNFYRFEFHRISGFGLEDNYLRDLVQLVPAGYDKTGVRNNKNENKIVTSNPDYFWNI